MRRHGGGGACAGILLGLVACGGTAAVGIGPGDAGGHDSARSSQDAGSLDASQDSTSTPDTTVAADTSAPDTTSQTDSEAPSDTSSPEDSATPFDSANPADTGSSFDSGHPEDSGNPFDSGHPEDSGNASDSGHPQDSGNPLDSGRDTGPDAEDDGGTCPSTPPLGMGTCSSVGLACSYQVPQEVCRCSHGAPVMVNATWHCSLLAPGCPSMQPTVGDTCSVPGLNCDYGMCLGGIDVVCMGGTWMQGMMFCPP